MRSVVMLGVPGLMAIVGVAGLVRWIFERWLSVCLPGVVMSHASTKDFEGDAAYRAVFAFEYEGERREVIDPMGMSWRPFRIGQSVLVLFRRGRPDEARIVRWWLPCVYVAIVAAGVAVLLLVIARI